MDSKKYLVGDNQETTLRDLQLKSLEILVYFRDFCEEHNLQFFLYGGTCIGAIRHEGFIPWDDDVDVVMPREDYEKLEKLWNQYSKEKKYVYCRSNKKINLKHPMITIRDKSTTYVRDYQRNLDVIHSVRLDIIPLDGCPDNNISRKIQLGWALIFHLFNREVTASSHFKYLTKISNGILKIIKNPNIRFKIWKYAEKKMTKYSVNESTKYLTDLQSYFRIMKIKYPKKYFEKAIYKNFEGFQMPVPVGYEEYLELVFGDYMQFPPMSERKPNHSATYINLKEPYYKYKGTYYCMGNKD